jgi:predicted NBD/HSP70 family sugar kinase
LNKALRDSGVPLSRISRIGVGHTGRIDVENGLCLDWEGTAHWRRINLAKTLKETFGIEICLDDRARAVALAHHLLWPEHARHRSAIYVQIGTGVGAAIFVNGRMLRGASLTGGELGHMVIDRKGPLCGCGKRGCVEAFASRGATLTRVRQAIADGATSSVTCNLGSPDQITLDLVVSAARRGDPVCKAAIEESGQALGIGIANAVQLLNPSLVVLAGKFANTARDFFLEAVTNAISTQCFETVARGLEVRVAPVRKDIAPVGCALLASLDVAQELVQHRLLGA